MDSGASALTLPHALKEEWIQESPTSNSLLVTLSQKEEITLLDHWVKSKGQDKKVLSALISAYEPLLRKAVHNTKRRNLTEREDKNADALLTLLGQFKKAGVNGYRCNGSLNTWHDYIFLRMQQGIIDGYRQRTHHRSGHQRRCRLVSFDEAATRNKSYSEVIASSDNLHDKIENFSDLQNLMREASLTSQEEEVITLEACGLEGPEICAAINRSKATLSKTRSSALRKMGEVAF